jgi:sugar phosphate isomerase/epimerase
MAELDNKYHKIIKKLFINFPFEHLNIAIDQILSHNIQPEIGFDGDVLYNYSEKDFEKIANKLHASGLSCTMHAPFFELIPGAADINIRNASYEKLKKCFNLIHIFQPESIICHLGFEDNKHGYRPEPWFENSMKTWSDLLEIASLYQTPVMLENTYETTPDAHLRILNALNSDLAGFCFDVGHTLAFAKNKWTDWLPVIEPYLKQIHLHDNHGNLDEHLAIGHGIFEFKDFFNYLDKNNIFPIMTIEQHQRDNLWLSLDALLEYDYIKRHPGC